MPSPAGFLLPYQSVDSMAAGFGLDEEIVWKWLRDLGGSRNYAYYFLHYWRWFKEKGYWRSAQEMIDEYNRLDEIGRAKHVEALKEYVKSKKTGSNDRKQVWHAVKHFYSNNIISTVPTIPTLPRTKAGKLFALSELDLSRNAQRVKLTDDQIRQLVMSAKMPYQSIFMILSQSGMGLAEFQQFNKTVWRTVVDKLDSTQPVQVTLYRSKMSRDKRQDYYTFLSRDSLQSLRDWLKVRDGLNVDDEHCFLVRLKRKNATRWVPVTGRMVGETLTETARRAELIDKGPNGSSNRYAIHCHEFRDRLRSICELNGVANAPADFFLGHEIDKLGYNKSPWYDPEHFREQYKKIEHVVNVISNTSRGSLKAELTAAFNAQWLKMFDWSDAELEKVNVARLTEKQVLEMVRQKQAEKQSQERKPKQYPIAVKVPKLKQYLEQRQRVVKIRQLKRYLKEGWRFIEKLPTGEVVIEMRS